MVKWEEGLLIVRLSMVLVLLTVARANDINGNGEDVIVD